MVATRSHDTKSLITCKDFFITGKLVVFKLAIAIVYQFLPYLLQYSLPCLVAPANAAISQLYGHMYHLTSPGVFYSFSKTTDFKIDSDSTYTHAKRNRKLFTVFEDLSNASFP